MFTEALEKRQQNLSVKFTRHSEVHRALPKAFCGHCDQPCKELASDPRSIDKKLPVREEKQLLKAISTQAARLLVLFPCHLTAFLTCHLLPHWVIWGLCLPRNILCPYLPIGVASKSSKVCSSQPRFVDLPWDSSSLPSAPHLCTLARLLLLG